MNKAGEFIQSITASQLEELIEAFFAYADSDTINKIFSRIDSDIKICYSNFFQKENTKESPESTQKKMITDEKFSEIFSSLIEDIECHIGELGDEDGEYVSQEHHWECPEFDAYQFSNDLEKIFRQMLPMLDKAYELKLEGKDFLLDIINEIQSGIDVYPEWMGAEYSEFEIETSGAECFLKWNWLNRDTINSFLLESKEMFDKKPLTSNFTQTFLENEPESILKELYKSISELKKNPEWEKLINNVDSIWHDIYHKTEAIADKKSFLKTSQKMISQKWEYGIPVYEEYLKDKDYENAEKYCRETAGEFFRQNTYGNFSKNTKTSIFASHCDKKDSRIDKTFKDWIELCEKLDDTIKAGTVEIQYAFYQNPYDWKKLKTLFLSNKNLPYYNSYLNEWKLFTTRKTLKQYYSDKDQESWLDFLIDFVLDEDKNTFISKTKQWLEVPLKVSSSYDHGKHYQLLLNFSKDVLPETGILKSYPRLKNYISGADYSHYDYDNENETNDKTKLKKERLLYLKKAGAESLKNEIIDTWKKNVHKFIPSPAEAHNAEYSRHAKWLAIAKELNQNTYRRFYNNWKTKHNRKRNLWSALAPYGIRK
ncbi:MAG: hypothetical protein K9L78_01310 [Victivallales bacterium]|nr:hypothetical protein [Victivallales bacterium]MCF7888735.1 hypothetical protein [Victivallales bacterium]